MSFLNTGWFGSPPYPHPLTPLPCGVHVLHCTETALIGAIALALNFPTSRAVRKYACFYQSHGLGHSAVKAQSRWSPNRLISCLPTAHRLWRGGQGAASGQCSDSLRFLGRIPKQASLHRLLDRCKLQSARCGRRSLVSDPSSPPG